MRDIGVVVVHGLFEKLPLILSAVFSVLFYAAFVVLVVGGVCRRVLIYKRTPVPAGHPHHARARHHKSGWLGRLFREVVFFESLVQGQQMELAVRLVVPFRHAGGAAPAPALFHRSGVELGGHDAMAGHLRRHGHAAGIDRVAHKAARRWTGCATSPHRQTT